MTDALPKLDHEGWAVFEASGSSLNANGDLPYQLQKIDEADVFDDDLDAWHHVWQLAEAGSEPHAATLRWLEANSLPEYEAIKKACSCPSPPS